jgi:tRNA-(ms[2]io[6]A)-hydroxylase
VLCLIHPTDPGWADVALADLKAVLVDHAHCEMKAASNALSLSTRWPVSHRIARALVDLAEEELQHFRAVVDLLEQRGIALGKPEVDEYAVGLRKLSHGPLRRSPSDSLADRLLVGALIEARSCERFRLLGEALAARGDALAAFYEDLFACEARHYRTLVDLAVEVTSDELAVRARLAALARAEGELAKRLGVRARVHG